MGVIFKVQVVTWSLWCDW